MLLSDTDIIKAIADQQLIMRNPDGQDLVINGRPEPGFAIEAMAIDLRINRIRSYRTGDWIKWNRDEIYHLRPNELIIVETYEHMAFGPLIAATLHPRARQSLLGIIGISTTVHPGWPGSQKGPNIKPAPLRISVYNHGPGELSLHYKESFCRMLLHQMSSAPSMHAPSDTEIFDKADKLVEDLQSKISRRLIFQKRGVRIAVVAVTVALATYLAITPLVPDTAKPLITAIGAGIVTHLLTR